MERSQEVPDSERGVSIICSWCQQNGNKLFTLETPSGIKSFCSELCFTQCRRASFKRNKVCEWCKHVRHTLNFVDFQDGDIQLQFCSEKCLNQYKMNIFCTEARQHLQHIQNMTGDNVKKSARNGKGDNQEKEILITPDLWLSAQSNASVAIKQEICDEELDKIPDIGKDNRVASKRQPDGKEPGEVQEAEGRWAVGTDVAVGTVLSDHSNCSNEDKLGQKVKSSLMSRQRKERLTSRLMTSNADARTSSDSCRNQDRNRIRKILCGANIDDHSHEISPSTSSVKERTDTHPSLSPQRNISFPPAMGGTCFSPQQMSSLSLLPNWAASQLLSMIPSHVSPSLAAANIGSSFGSLGYVSNPLLYSSLFGPTPLALTAQKEMASSSLTKSRNESRRELLRDRSFEGERGNVRAESTERSTRSTSSSYSSSDTPGLPSTPGVTIPTVPELATDFVPGFTQQLPHSLHPNNLSQPLPHYITDPTVAGMFPAGYSLNHSHRGCAPAGPTLSSAAPLTHHTPAPAVTTTQPQHLSVPPVTILVPYPVPIPIPVPVPIPLPITPEKLFAFFQEKSAQAKTTTATPSTQQWPAADHRPASSMGGRSRASSVSHTVNSSPIVSPQHSSKSLSFGHHPYASSLSVLNSTDPALVLPSGRESADSIMTLRREIGGSQTKLVSASSFSSTGLKRTITAPQHMTLDCSKKARLDCLPPHGSEDEAMDLSKMSSRSSSPRISGNCSEKENTTLVKQASLSDSDMDSSSQTPNLTVPRIHIISDQAEPPLCQPSLGITLPSPPQQSSYSGRRSRILDAPSVPKKMRSPSPERRYVRTVPRDMVEAARRRGLRARVRTK